jgi:hypothetical protein
MTSVGYIATFHMAAQTQAVVFTEILLIPARASLALKTPLRLCCAEHRGAADKGPVAATCLQVLCGEGSCHPVQEHLPRHPSEASGA